MTAEVEFTSRALRELADLPDHVQRRLAAAIERLRTQWPLLPRLDVKRLQGRAGFWRLRVGDYRALFESTPNALVFTRFAHRSQIYN